MFSGQNVTTVLKVNDGEVRMLEDAFMGSYSIGLATDEDFQWKFISKELHDLLKVELEFQEGSK